MNNFINTIKDEYNAEEDNIGSDFLKPCLENCLSYDRWGSYFTSNSIDTFKEIIPNIIYERQVKMRFVLTPQIEKKDYEILKTIIDPKKRKEFLENHCEKIMEDVLGYAQGEGSSEQRLKIFFWLLDQSIIEIKFAFMKNNKGIFHSKTGIFTFENGNQVAFTGSMNETKQAHMDNFDEIDVYRSWHDENEKERIRKKIIKFNKSWDNSMSSVEIYGLSKGILSKIKTYTLTIKNEIKDKLNSGNGEKDIFDKLWPHQKKALEEFVKKKKGVLELATGTGKTFTGLAIFKKLFINNSINSLIVFTKDVPLLKQWYEEIVLFNKTYFKNKLKIFRHFSNFKEISGYLFEKENSVLILRTPYLSSLINRHNFNYEGKILIGDEIHDFGSSQIQMTLSDKIKPFEYSLGLSATPERKFDKLGTEFILNEIGPVLENCKYGLKEAIRDGILCNFNYFTIEYDLTESEKNLRQQKIRDKEGLIQAARSKYGNNPKLLHIKIKEIEEKMAREIANIYKSAENKLIGLKDFISRNPEILESTFLFAYPHAYAERVIEIIHNYNLNYEYLRDGEEDSQLKKFAKGEIQTIIAVKKLSQGIDFKNLSNIIMMFSQSSDLMTIQRIGRCLRKNPKDEGKTAKIVDFINKEYETDIKRKIMINEILEK